MLLDGGNMKKEFYVSNLDATDLNMHYCGYEKCAHNHYYGPATRDHYLFVYVKSGKGKYRIKEKTFEIQQGQSFFLFPGYAVFYQADSINPWEYMWVGFYGKLSYRYLQYINVSPNHPIYNFQNSARMESLFKKLFSELQLKRRFDEIFCTGILHLMFHEMARGSSCILDQSSLRSGDPSEKYMEKALHFIHMNYTEHISASLIAGHVGLERSYFSKLFKRLTGRSPCEYINRHRLDKAYALLCSGAVSVEHVAFSVGFRDPLYFSKAFKKHFGFPPSHTGKNLK